MNRTTDRRLIKLETGSVWWREKHNAGTLTADDMRLMTDADLIACIGLTHPDPEAFMAEYCASVGAEYIGPDDRARQRGSKANGRANGHNGATYPH